MSGIPTPDTITASWLTARLREAGHASAEVRGFGAARVGTGQIGESAGPPFELLREPFAAVHVDYRLDNLLIDEGASPPRIAVVDWQTVTLGSPLSDVAYFLGAGLLPDARRAAEREIVRAYHDGLVAAGVEGYDCTRCWEDYRRGAFAGFVVTVIASMIVERTARGDAMFVAMARRHARHALDLGAVDLLR